MGLLVKTRRRRSFRLREGLVVAGAMIALAVTSAGFAQDSIGAPPKRFSDEYFGFGICTGKGAGLVGLYTYLRPVSPFALEVSAGRRVFIWQDLGGPDVVAYPGMLTVKLQTYFTGRQKRSQYGAEVGWLYTEDAGSGFEGAGIVQLRLARNLNLDGSLGIGFFQDVEKATRDFMQRRFGSSAGSVFTPPVFAMWGFGLSIAF